MMETLWVVLLWIVAVWIGFVLGVAWEAMAIGRKWVDTRVIVLRLEQKVDELMERVRGCSSAQGSSDAQRRLDETIDNLLEERLQRLLSGDSPESEVPHGDHGE